MKIDRIPDDAFQLSNSMELFRHVAKKRRDQELDVHRANDVLPIYPCRQFN
jgi:hypothetical protein